MNEDEKNKYINEAEKLKKPSLNNVKKPRKLTGYNLYYKEINNNLKDNIDKDKQNNMSIMTYISNKWNKLSKDDKQIWIDKAKNM